MRRFPWIILVFGLSAACMHRRSDASRPAARAASTRKVAAALHRNFALAPAIHPGESATSAVLAERGVARMPIVVSTKAAPETRRVANELAGFLGRATGAHFEVTAGDGARGIVVGTAQEFDVGKDAPALAVKNEFDGREAYLVRSESSRVLLVGATPLGVPHAVYSFLDALGFRWLFPAKEWEEIPDLPTLRVDVHLTDRPRLLSRSMGPGWGFFDPEAKSDWETWTRHNRLGESLPAKVGHAWYAIIARNKKEFDAHPEYFALSGGKRLTHKLCVTNPGVQKVAIEYAMWALSDPAVDMVSLESSDGTGYCECERCKAMGPPSAQPFYLANVVAKEIQRRHPGKLVGMLAYADHSEPPPFSLEPNVLVEITNGYNYGKYSVAELAEHWPKVARYLGYYEYFSVYQGDGDMLPGMASADPAHLADLIRFYASHSGVALTAETGNNWGPYGRAYYMASRLMWNPDTDVSAALGDFYASAFHAGAPAMKRFYERFDPGNNPFMCRSLLHAGYADVAEATRAAQGDDTVQARLDHIKAYLHYAFSQYELEGATDKETRRRLALDVLTEAYRTRRSYMNHWRALWTDYSPKAAKEFNEPSWSRAAPGAHPWAVEAPVVHSALEKRFEQEMAALPARAPVREAQFSKRLVRVREDSEARRRTEKTLYQFVTAQRFALSSDAGEPVEFTVQTGLIGAYANKPAARYTIRDADERPIAEGRIPLDYDRHTVKEPVPGAGVYYLDFNDSGAGFQLTVPEGRAATLMLLQKGKAPSLGTLDRFYFYVPKGTPTIDYFWTGAPHVVRGPDGALVRAVDTKNDWVSVPVPAGKDGKVWYLQSLRTSVLKFVTVPNNVATASDALLVPEDVARADGLKVTSR